ncbi:hypothetical protein BJX99DRAFT_185782 [Aspergillus californicus]
MVKTRKMADTGDSRNTPNSPRTGLMSAIFLQMDMHTLINCQRVCRAWKELIKSSSKLQEALFLKPARMSSSRNVAPKPNLLLREIIWPQICLKPPRNKRRLASRVVESVKASLKGELTYLRPEASWRNMFFQQPPTGRIGIVELLTDHQDVPELSVIAGGTQDRPMLLRMCNLLDAIGDGLLTPGGECGMIWAALPRNVKKVHTHCRDSRAYAVDHALFACDFIVLTPRRLGILKPDPDGDEEAARKANRGITEFDR